MFQAELLTPPKLAGIFLGWLFSEAKAEQCFSVLLTVWHDQLGPFPHFFFNNQFPRPVRSSYKGAQRSQGCLRHSYPSVSLRNTGWGWINLKGDCWQLWLLLHLSITCSGLYPQGGQRSPGSLCCCTYLELNSGSIPSALNLIQRGWTNVNSLWWSHIPSHLLR